MDFRIKDAEGKTICPCCYKHYIPDLPEPNKKDREERIIQDIYPKATKIQREQLITGICSNDCWNIYLGTPDEDEEDESDLYTPEEFKE